jgi:hypothetical protein
MIEMNGAFGTPCQETDTTAIKLKERVAEEVIRERGYGIRDVGKIPPDAEMEMCAEIAARLETGQMEIKPE